MLSDVSLAAASSRARLASPTGHDKVIGSVVGVVFVNFIFLKTFDQGEHQSRSARDYAIS